MWAIWWSGASIKSLFNEIFQNSQKNHDCQVSSAKKLENSLDHNQNLVSSKLKISADISAHIGKDVKHIEILGFEEKILTWKSNGRKKTRNAYHFSTFGVFASLA